MKEYYYLENNEQRGPVSLENLKALNITRNTLVWTEGMNDWLPAGQVSEIASAFPPKAPPPVQVPGVTPPPVSPPDFQEPRLPEREPKPLFSELDPFGNVASSNSGMRVEHTRGLHTVSQINNRFTAYSILYFLTLAIVLMGIVVIAIMAVENARDEEVGIAAGLIFGTAIFTGLGALIANCMITYAAWENIQDEPSVRSTPGQAIGLLFVPLWHYYQVFVTYRSLVEDMNAYIISRGYDTKEYINQGIATGACISRACMAIPYIGMIAWLPQLVLQYMMMSQIRKGLNFLLSQKEEALQKQGF